MATYTTSESYGATPIIDSSLILYMDSGNPKSYSNYNLFSYTKDFNTAFWSRGFVTSPTTNNLAPDGTNTAVFMKEDATNNIRLFSSNATQNVLPLGYRIFTASVYMKAVTRNYGTIIFYDGVTGLTIGCVFNLSNGTLGVNNTAGSGVLLDYSMTLDNNGYYKCVVTGLMNVQNSTAGIGFGVSNTNAIVAYTGDNTSGIHIWGAQLTEGWGIKPYQSNNSTRPTLVTNIASTSNNGTLTNGVIVSNGNGGIFNFDGVNDYINIGNAINVGQDFTVEMWVKPTSFSVRNALLANGYTYGLPGYGWLLTLVNGATAGINNSFALTIGHDTPATSAPTNTLSVNIWQHITAVVTSGGTNISLYYNGLLVKSTNSSSATVNYTSNNTCYIGQRNDGTTECFQGSMALPMIYNRVLSAQEVWQNYQAFKNRFQK